jgi:N utilization substance protein A
MFITDIKRVVDQISRDKGIDRDVLISALEEAVKSAAKKKFGSKIDIETQYNERTGEIEVFQFKEVAETVTDPEIEISLEEGRRLDPGCEIGDSLGTKMDTTTFGRIAAQSAKQVIIQKMKDAERDAVYASFIDRKGEIINGIVQRFDRGDIIVNLGPTEGVVPVREQVPRENYRRGDRIRALILDILYETRGPQIVLSRTHPDFMVNLFKTEVPEISEGIVTIMGAAREPGVRAKIAVSSNDSDIDPVGACVGMKGSRVQNVVQELKGEKIDIIPWHVDPAKFVCNALAPAEISRVIIDEENKSMEVIVPDEFLSIAIGKRGQNVRLASKLTGWHLDVKSESRYSEDMQSGYDSLVAMEGMTVSMADALYESGFYSAEEVSHASVEDLMQMRGIDEDTARQLIDAAEKRLVAQAAEEAAEAEREALEMAEQAAAEAEAAAQAAQSDEENDEGSDASPETADEVPDETAGTDEDATETDPAGDEDATETDPAGEAEDLEPTVEDAAAPEPAAEEATTESHHEPSPEEQDPPPSDEENKTDAGKDQEPSE